MQILDHIPDTLLLKRRRAGKWLLRKSGLFQKHTCFWNELIAPNSRGVYNHPSSEH